MLIGALSSPALIGREQDVAALVDCALGPPALALVEGEAGAGKTRVVAEFLSRAELRDRRRLLGGCSVLQEPLPLAPIVEALRSAPVGSALTSRLSPVATPADVRLGPGGGPLDAMPSFGDLCQRHRAFLEVVELLGHMGPTVLVLEDMHRWDDLTGELVRFLVPRLPANLSLVLTYRREELELSSQLLSVVASRPPGAGVTRVELSPLSLDETARMAAAILGLENVSPHYARYVHQRAAGLPFAVEEVVRLLLDRPDLAVHGGLIASVPDIHRVPETVRDVVLERVAQLGPDAGLVTDAAAVVGTPACETVLRKVAGLTRARAVAALSDALRAAVLYAVPGGYGFRHPLASQAVYEAVPAPARTLMHLRAARALDVVPKPLALLAHHYRQAGKTSEWLRYSEAAADLAAQRGDESAAADFLQPAVDSGSVSGPARVRMALKFAGAAARGSVRLHDCVESLTAVIDEETLTPGTRGELRLFLGSLTREIGRTSDGRCELVRCVPELRRRPQLAAKAMAWLARPDVIDVHLTEHLRWMDRAMEAITAQDDPKLRIDVLHTRAHLLNLVGDPAGDAAAADIPWEASSPRERRMLTWTSFMLSGVHFHAGRYEEAKLWLDDTRRRAQELVGGAESYAGAIATQVLLLDWAAGQWANLEERARNHSLCYADVPRQSVAARRIAAHVAAARGDPDRAERSFDVVLNQGHDIGFIPALVFASAGRARIHLVRDDPEGAVEETAFWFRVIAGKGIWVWAAELAPVTVEAMLAARQLDDARDLTTRFATGLRQRHTPLAQSALQSCQAMVAAAESRWDDAECLWRRAMCSYASLPRPYDAAWAEARLGMCELDRSRPDGSTHLLAALATFGRLGASADAGRVRQALKERSITPPHSGGRRPYGNCLSPREQEVVRLAASHMTNARIAVTLGLSSKTVGHHIESAMRKLGVTSRRAFSSYDLPEPKNRAVSPLPHDRE